MRKLLSILSLALLLQLIACTQRSSFRVSIGLISPDADPDSVTLYVYEPEYGALRVIGGDSVRAGEYVTFSGFYQGEKIAFAKLASDTAPYFFTLDSVPTVINIGVADCRHRIRVFKGSTANHAMIRLYNRLELLSQERDSARARYNAALSDSLLDASREARLLRAYEAADSSLRAALAPCADSLRPLSYIIGRRFPHLIPLIPSNP